MKPTTREVPDPLGRPVDVYLLPNLICVLLIDNSPDNIEELIRHAALKALREIGHLGNKRLRERDFPVYFCSWTASTGNACTGLGIPSPTNKTIFQIFRRQSEINDLISEVGDSAPLDVGARPLFRYTPEKITYYADPLESSNDSFAIAEGLEIRTAEMQPKRRHSTTSSWGRPAMRPVEFRDGCTLETWEELQAKTLYFIGELKGNGSYSWLRREVRKGLGLRVVEQPISVTGVHGSLAPGWIYHDLSCDPVISINQALSSTLKYVVLAHELAHFALHFPFVYCTQLAEQMAWSNPTLEYSLSRDLVALLEGLPSLEDDANFLASYLLMPRWMDPESVSRIVIESTGEVSPEEMTWRFLQHAFPEHRIGDYSWRNMHRMKERAKAELAAAKDINELTADSLYLMMLRATLDRSSPQLKVAREKIDAGIDEFIGRMLGSNVDDFGSMSLPPELPLATDAHGSAFREILPAESGSISAPRLPIVPAVRNSEDRWVSIIGTLEDALPVNEWRALYRDRTIVKYPHADPPRKPVMQFGETNG